MTLPTYTAARRREIAAMLSIDEQYLYQILRGINLPSAALARKIHLIDPSARLQDLRPNDWREIWPELIGSRSQKQKRSIASLLTK